MTGQESAAFYSWRASLLFFAAAVRLASAKQSEALVGVQLISNPSTYKQQVAHAPVANGRACMCARPYMEKV